MAALQCEICGGKLVGKPGGLFECEYCGMEYNTDWAKAKIQEIKGTVKVEGTVQVAGTVKVEGGVSVESLLQRGQMALEDCKWQEAISLFDQVLSIDFKCAEAYLGKALATNHISKLANARDRIFNLQTEKDYSRALEFASPLLRKQIETEVSAALEKIKAEKQQYEQERIAECLYKKNQLAAARAKLEPVKNIIAAGEAHWIGLKYDGTVVAKSLKSQSVTGVSGECCIYSWYDIVAVAAGAYHSVGLKTDGTVVAEGDNSRGQCNVESWQNIKHIAAGGAYTIGVRKDGTVATTGAHDLSGWHDIIEVATDGTDVFGLRSDGTVIATGDKNDCVRRWKEVVSVSGSGCGLLADGSVKLVNYDKNPGVDILAIAGSFTLDSNGKIGEITFDCSYPKTVRKMYGNFVAIAATDTLLVGVQEDGTVIAKDLRYASSDPVTATEKLFSHVDTLQQERMKAAEEQQIALAKQKAADESLRQEQMVLQAELSQLKGLFTGKRRKEIEIRLKEIENELDGE